MFDINLVQQGAWDTPLESMPLATAYIKATLEADPDISLQVQVSISNFRGGVPLTHMAHELFSRRLPDVLAFSVLGWNYRNFCCLAETYKQMRPDGLVVFGGNTLPTRPNGCFKCVHRSMLSSMVKESSLSVTSCCTSSATMNRRTCPRCSVCLTGAQTDG